MRFFRNQTSFILYNLLAAMEAGAGMIYMISIPGDPKNSVFLGFSTQRLFIMGVLFAAFSVFLALTLVSWRAIHLVEKLFQKFFLNQRAQSVLLASSALLFTVGGITAFIPGYRFYDFQAYFERLRPLIIWVTLVSMQTLIPLMVFRFGWHPKNLIADFKYQRSARVAGLITLGICALIWVFISATGIGLKPDSLYWNDIGVPVLGLQVIFATGIAFGCLFITKWIVGARAAKMDLYVCILIWLAATTTWFLQPQPSSFFAPGPYAPNNEYYPFSDAAGYDISAQRALIGMGYNTPECPDKPFYIALLTWMHLLGGQQYNAVIFWQIVLLAFFPVILYLIGKQIHSSTAGILVASLIIIKEANAITASLLIRTSHSKLMLSETTTALMLSLLALFLLLWIKRPASRTQYAILAGGVLGLAILVRLNTLALLPMVLGIMVIVNIKAWRHWVFSGTLLTGMLILCITPWMWRSSLSCNTSPLSFILAPIQGILLQQRYQAPTPTPAGSGQITPIHYKVASAILPEALFVAGPQNPTRANKFPTNLEENFDEAMRFIPAHFLHNLVANVLMLPTSLVHDDLFHRLKTPGGYWDPLNVWDGTLDPIAGILLITNLGLIAVGAGFGWNRAKLAGLVPLAVCLGYHLSTAVARTSGGRYLVPADWGILLYYGIGLAQIGAWVISAFSQRVDSATITNVEEPLAIDNHKTRRIILTTVGILFIAVMIPLNEKFFPSYEERVPFVRTTEKIFRSGVIGEAGFSEKDMQQWLSTPSTLINNWVFPYIYSGRALYPRFFPMNQGVPYKGTAYQNLDYPRLVFQVIGPRLVGTTSVILPLESPPTDFPNGADVFVFGCMTENSYVSAYLVIIIGSEYTTYVRSPMTSLECPPRTPVCDDNHICR